MNILTKGALSVLERVYSDDLALFPFTTRLVDNEYRSVFDHPRRIRSTINCLLGLQEAARHAPQHPFLSLTEHHIRRFLELHESSVHEPADVGLLLLLLSERHVDPEATIRTLRRVGRMLADRRRLRRLNVQDLSWMLWGSVAAARSGVPNGESVARRAYRALLDNHLSPDAILPSHAGRFGRFGVVSFGACVYFLRSLSDYGQAFDDGAATAAFQRGVEGLLAAQGPMGEWPWLVSNADARPLDFYPVFSVHQNSMSMLFLLPARDLGASDIDAVIARSLGWIGGRNQLDLPMVQQDPFFIYRSLERKAAWPRYERALRAVVVGAAGQAAGLAPNHQVRINRESRSYELGWVLYVQSGRPTFSGVDPGD